MNWPFVSNGREGLHNKKVVFYVFKRGNEVLVKDYWFWILKNFYFKENIYYCIPI